MNRLTPSEVIRPTPVYVTGADARFSANDEPEDDEAAVFEEAEEDDDICIHCNGSGEGQYDGTRCTRCRGRGAIYYRDED